MKKYFFTILVAVLAVMLVACGGGNKQQGLYEKDGYRWVKVGDAPTLSGTYATVGTPVKQMMQAVFDEYNRGGLFGGLINNTKVDYIAYDDQGKSDVGVTLTEKLIEEDKVFALVCHFGTWTVVPTLKKIKDVGIPMVHAATGTNKLYAENTVHNPVMPIQPIYKTDGRVMTARAFSWKVFGVEKNETLPDNAKVGVIYSDDDAGRSILEGINAQLELFENAGKTFTAVEKKLPNDDTGYSAIAESVKDVDVLLIASNQKPFQKFVSTLHDKSIKAPIFTSYVNADIAHINQAEANVGEVFMNGWYRKSDDPAYQEYERIIDASTTLDKATKEDLKTSTHAKSAYTAAMTFLEGLRRVGEKELTWDNYIKAMEEAPIDLLIAGKVDFTGGKRIGTDTMSLWQYDREKHEIVLVDTLKSIDELAGTN